MNVLFIDTPSLSGCAHEDGGVGLPAPNMGIMYMAACLKERAKATVKVLDLLAANLSFEDLGDEIRRFNPDLVGITSKTFNVLAAYEIAALAKRTCPNAFVLLGGAHATALPEFTLDECRYLDAVALGEGEHTIMEVHERLACGYTASEDVFQGVDGIVWREASGGVTDNGPRGPITDLDSLPFPDLSLVDYRTYTKLYNAENHKFQPVYSVFASRGCPFNCTFCMPLLTRRYRVREVESVIEEVELLHHNHGARRIYFEDSLFGASKAWFERFCELFMKRGLHKKVHWGFETRIDTSAEASFKLAKAAGCIYTFFGVESGCEHVLEKARKNYQREDIIRRTEAARAAGIAQVHVSIILGLPYETKQTIEETFRLLDEIPYHWAHIHLLDVYPGTQVFEMADRGEGGLRWIEGKRMNWDAYARGTPMVEVNDLNAEDLTNARAKAIAIRSEVSNKSRGFRFRRSVARAIDLAKTDRAQFRKNLKSAIRDTFSGFRSKIWNRWAGML